MIQQGNGPYLTLELVEIDSVKLSTVYDAEGLVEFQYLQHVLLFIATIPVQLVPQMPKGFTISGRSLNPGRALPGTTEWDMIFLLSLLHPGYMKQQQ